MDACLERIATVEPTIRAVVDVQSTQVLAQARRMDAEGPSADKPLLGVPEGASMSWACDARRAL